MAGYWIKFYHEVLDDPKMATLPDRLWRRFYELCLIAGRNDQDGDIPETKQIAWTLRMQVDDLQSDLDELQKLGLINQIATGWNVTHFSKRQSKLDSAEKVRRYREEQKRDKYYTGDVTEPVTNVLPPVTQKERKKDIDTDKEKERKIEGASAPDNSSPSPSPSASDAWIKALGDIQSHVSSVTFETYLAQLQLSQVHNSRDKPIFVVKALTTPTAELVRKRYGQTLAYAIQGYYGKPVELQIVS